MNKKYHHREAFVISVLKNIRNSEYFKKDIIKPNSPMLEVEGAS